jgi:hypothetical protein
MHTLVGPFFLGTITAGAVGGLHYYEKPFLVTGFLLIQTWHSEHRESHRQV